MLHCLQGEDYNMKEDQFKEIFELITCCNYCTKISNDREDRSPIACTKYSGSPHPIFVNLNTCLVCGEYINSQEA